jgi:hypothetical protein
VGVQHSSCPTTNPPTYSGPTTITQDGTRIYNVRINSQLTIYADNVTVECAVISAPTAQRGILVGGSGSPANNTRISKVKIYNVYDPGSGYKGKCIYYTGHGSNLTLEYSDLSQCEDGIHAEGKGANIYYNWIHDLKVYSGLHSDGITVAAGSSYDIHGNRFGPFANASAAIMVQPAGSCPSMSDIDIFSNYIDHDGDGHALLSDRSVGCTCPTGMDILNNQFGANVGTPISYGSGDKACPPVGQRGGSCSGNKRYDGSSVGC